jgi:hypothetical protein
MQHQQDNFSFAPYSFVGSVMPWSWSNPCYYLHAKYSSTHMQPYKIQYPILHPTIVHYKDRSHAISIWSQKNKVHVSVGQCESSNKQHSKVIQLRWCPLRFMPHSKEKITKDVFARSNGATNWRGAG